MITKQLENGAAVEITTNAGFLHDGIQYEAFLSYNDGKAHRHRHIQQHNNSDEHRSLLEQGRTKKDAPMSL